MPKAILYDSTLCIGCRACEGGCAERWGLPYNDKIAAEETISAHKLTTIVTHGDHFCRRLCMNCLQPACASVCPVAALQKTALGPVTYDAAKCIGCRYCMQACPFQVPTYEWSSRLPLMRKCDMCYARQSAGKLTACAEVCPTGATFNGQRDALIAEAHRRLAAKPDQYYQKIYGLSVVGGTSVLFLSAVPFEQIGLRTNVPHEPMPMLTWRVLELLPDVVSTGSILLGGIWWITNRALREGRAAQGGTAHAQGDREVTPLPKITVWRAIFAAIMLSGAYATYLRMFYGLGGSTNLSDKFPWGLWIGFDVMCGVGLAAGGFTLVAMVHIFNIKQYRPVLRPAILTAFLGYLLVTVGLLYDLGRPDRLWHPLVMWNPHSVMFEVAWCVTLYSTVLFLEFLPMVFERFGLHKPLEWIHRISVPLMILGVLLSTLHQSSLGTLFLIVPEKLYPLWYTPILPLLFYISAIAVGLAMTIFESWHSSRAFGRALELPLLASMGRVLAVVLSVYLWIRFLDLLHRDAFGLLPRNRTETWLFVLEIALMVVPTRAAVPVARSLQPGRPVCLRGDGGVRLHRQPPERGHHRAGGG